MKWIKRLFCKHKHIEFKNNIYGDPINLFNKRSMWKCTKCKKIILKDTLYKVGIDPY